MNTQFNTVQTLSGFLGLIVMTFFVILLLKWILRRATRKLEKKGKNNIGKWSVLLALRNKYPEADAFRYSGFLLRYGMMVALSASFLAFNWTVYERPVYIPEGTLDMDEAIAQIPITTQLPKLIPPPPPTTIEPVEEDVELEDSHVFESMDIGADDKIADYVENEPMPPPPPPPPRKVIADPFVSIAEEMPRFPGCEDAAMSIKEKEECAKMKMLEYIYRHLKYPVLARETRVEGTVVIQFIVDRDGRIETVNIVRDIGAGCGEAAAKIVLDMNELPDRWSPGRQRGRPVKVLYTLPVKFKLEG